MPETLTAPIADSALPIAEAMAAAEAAGAPVERPLPGFEPPPYDAAGWNRKIASKNRGVATAHTAWELARDKAGNLKKVLDRESKELSDLIVTMDTERRYAEGELVQPSLRPVPQGVGSSSCRYEQATNTPCPLCRLLRASGCPLPDPEDTQHAEYVHEALEPPDRAELLAWVSQVCGQIVSDATYDAWTPEQRAELQLWCVAMEHLGADANEPARPAVLGTPHVAAEAGESVQSCTRCGSVILDLARPDVDAYDTGALVGTDCEPPDEQSATFDSSDPVTKANLEEALAAHKACLCETPDFLVPADKDDQADARCTKCDGAPDGGVYKVRFAKPTKKGKR